MRTLKFKILLTIVFFVVVNHNYGDSQWTMKNRNKQNGSKTANHNWQTRPFDPVEVKMFSERSAKMSDGSKKRKALVENWISEFAYHWKLQ